MADLQGLIHNVPPVTRFFLISIVLVTGSVVCPPSVAVSVKAEWRNHCNLKARLATAACTWIRQLACRFEKRLRRG
jgi:hypothetical protein